MELVKTELSSTSSLPDGNADLSLDTLNRSGRVQSFFLPRTLALHSQHARGFGLTCSNSRSLIHTNKDDHKLPNSLVHWHSGGAIDILKFNLHVPMEGTCQHTKDLDRLANAQRSHGGGCLSLCFYSGTISLRYRISGACTTSVLI